MRVLLERVQLAEQRAAEEAALRDAAEQRAAGAEQRAAEEAAQRQAAERRAAEAAAQRQAAERRAAEAAAQREAAEQRAAEAKKLVDGVEQRIIEQRRALEQANKWSRVVTRASLLPEAKKEIYTVDEGLAMGDIPPLSADVADALAAAVEPFSLPPENAPEENAYTNGSVHSTALAVLLAVEGCVGQACALRRFYEQELERTASGERGPKNRPDFSYTYRHEAEATLLSSLVNIELKTRLTRQKSASVLLDEGYVQCFRYGAARVLHLRERFPGIARHEAVIILSNLATLSVMRVVFTEDKFAVYASRDEPLLPPPGASAPTPQRSLAPGVALLARVLCASPAQLGGVLASPPDALQVQRQRRGAAALVPVGDLLGRGGFCDVFEGTWDGARCAVKLPRTLLGEQPRAAASARTLRLLRREAAALRKVAQGGAASPHVPVLLGTAFELAAPHPALVMQPVGVVATHAPGAASPPGSPERRALAEACAAGVLAALRAAHDAGVLHTDVRPTNVIWVESARVAVLADWGIARAGRASLRALQPAALGWPDCAPDAALRAAAGTGPPWLPSRGTDCESAVYALAAVAFGDPCGEAPWSRDVERIADARVAAAASAIAGGDAGVAQRAVATAVEAARLDARDAWFAALPRAHPLRAARAAAHAAQGFSRVGPYTLGAGWTSSDVQPVELKLD